jgi:hypothetical protein
MAFAALELPFDASRLLADLLDGLRHADADAFAASDAVKELLAAGMERDVHTVPALLARDDDLRRDGCVVQHPFQLAEFGFYNPAYAGGDVDVASSELEAHKRNSKLKTENSELYGT